MDKLYYYPVLWLLVAGLMLGLIAITNALAAYQRRMSEHPELAAASDRQLRILAASRYVLWIFVGIMTTGGILAFFTDWSQVQKRTAMHRQSLWPTYDAQTLWQAPDIYLAETDDEHKLIAYGRDLIAHTQDYYGENGLVRPGSINGLNCQSCHLDAGSRPWGNNYFAVNSTYPQMRARSGSLETIPKRINDCFQRSLNGQPLDTTSREMRAMMAYMEWLGTGIPKGQKPKGAGLVEVPFLDRPADPVRGQHIYAAKCASCHGADGQGLPMPDVARNYPPLWGEKSYNEGAGLFRMSRLAGYVKANMPFGATFDNPQLSDEEAWDVSAFVNSQPRPKHPFLQTDWPKTEKKPYDHPFGPFADSFPEAQHKFGPFGPIVSFYKK